MCANVFTASFPQFPSLMKACPQPHFGAMWVDRVKVSDMFSGLDWPGLNMLICHPNLLLPCQDG